MSQKGMSNKQLLDVLKVQSNKDQSDLNVSSASESEYVSSDNVGAVGNSDEEVRITNEIVNEVPSEALETVNKGS
ncbi:hypothetical protein FQA39_LY06743 [Lamprigera yunnana]|nr:hypothetical protein FQA39_LY06743 [Lamprigera yunnana]